MSTIKQIVGTRTSLSFAAALDTLASATYIAASANIDLTTNDPIDVLLEVTGVTTNAVAGNKKLDVFVQGSLDGTNFETGPTSGTATADEPDLTFVGSVPMNTSNTHRKILSVAQAFGGVLPKSIKVVLRNDLGVALTTGSTVYYSEVSGEVV